MASVPPVCDFGRPAPEFRLPDTEGRIHTRDSLKGPAGLLVMFICNHCPYVLAIADKIAKEGAAAQTLGFGVAAICANDATAYPEDGFDRMGPFAKRYGFGFPYLHDADQTVARAHEAACTPDFFAYNGALELQYRGRLDASGRAATGDAPRELFMALQQIAETGAGPREQTASIGCSIKWKAA